MNCNFKIKNMSIFEEAMNLPKEEKVRLYYALQENLNFEDDILEEADLTKVQWDELLKREKELDNGTMKTITTNDFNKFLKERRSGLQTDKG